MAWGSPTAGWLERSFFLCLVSGGTGIEISFELAVVCLQEISHGGGFGQVARSLVEFVVHLFSGAFI